MSLTYLFAALAPLCCGQGQERYHDFRGGRPLPEWLYLVGPDVAAVNKQESEGWRFTLPTERKQGNPVGIRTTFALEGDFTVTGGFEILSAERPMKGLGVGVAFNLTTRDGTKFAKLGRFVRPQKGDVYIVEAWLKGESPLDVLETAPTTALTGRLRLERRGKMLHYLVADGAEEQFREIHRHEFVTDDLDVARFVVNNTASGAAVDARLLDWRIQMGSPAKGPVAGAPVGNAPAPTNETPASSGFAALWSVVVLGLLALVLAVVYFLSRRRGARPQERSAAQRSRQPRPR